MPTLQEAQRKQHAKAAQAAEARAKRKAALKDKVQSASEWSEEEVRFPCYSLCLARTCICICLRGTSCLCDVQAQIAVAHFEVCLQVRMLDKALVKFPVGVPRRWEQVATYVRTRTQDEILFMVKVCSPRR